jgi:two-component system nitrate/nitrite sensor histidine kinase NarX
MIEKPDSTTVSIPLKDVTRQLSAGYNMNTTGAAVDVAVDGNDSELLDDSSLAASRVSPAKIIHLPWQAWTLLIALFLVFIAIGATYFWATTTGAQSGWVPPVMTALWLLAGLGGFSLLYWMWREFTIFVNDLSQWATQLRNSNLAVRMPIKRDTCPSKAIREHLNSITDDYESLAIKQQNRLSRQQKAIKQKKHHLSVLYDVAACINQSQNLEDLLNRFLFTLRDVVNAKAATVRLLDKNGDMRLVASIGLPEEVVENESVIPVDACMCGKAACDSVIKVRADVNECNRLIGQDFFKDETNVELLAIPLQYRKKTLGVYNLFVSGQGQTLLDEEHELLMSIGQHLGMAIEKASVDEEAQMLSIIEERTRIAHELHDSLAQTLASLRFQVRLFDDSLNRGDDAVIWQELEGLEETIDLAYAELRSLITHFRAPIDGKGIVRAVERIVDRFKQETDLEVFFYHNWALKELGREIELEAVRIVQEALANVRKHSHADTVRILMYSSEDGKCSILVEDDGIGLPENPPGPNLETGEHIGLSVMEERAQRIDGELQIDSDDGEGTLVQLTFDVIPAKKMTDIVYN